MAEGGVDLEQARLNVEVTRELRRRLERHGKSIGLCDGINKEALRTWLDGIDNAAAWTNAPAALVFEMAGYLSGGSLATTLRRFVEDTLPDDRTWENAKLVIIRAFLNEDEREYLRSKVERMKQQVGEDSREFGRKFREAVLKAYSNAELQVPLVIERLVNVFTNALLDREVRSQVYLQRPATIDAAIGHANNAARAVGLAEYGRHREEEPMEIGALPIGKDAKDQLSAEVTKLRATVKTLRGEIKALKGTQGMRGAKQLARKGAQQNRRSEEDFKEGRCFYCHETGHFKKDCPKRNTAGREETIALLEEILDRKLNRLPRTDE